MKLLVTFQGHFQAVKGEVFCRYPVYEVIWKQYLQVFDSLMIVARVKPVEKVPDNWTMVTGPKTANPTWSRIDGQSISMLPMPDPQSPLKALAMFPKIVKATYRAIKSCDRYLLKLPGPTATLVGLLLLLLRKKYVVEVVADSKKGILFAKKKMPFVWFYAALFDELTKFLVKRAECATYVSRYLRKRYPNRLREREWVFCSAELSDEIIGEPRSAESFKTDLFKVFSIGRMSAEKGHIYLVRAFKKVCQRADKPVELHLVGDGPERSRLEKEAESLDIGNCVYFHGYVKRGPELFSLLDEAHLFIMPSLTEGMGRGLIEAMARGLPCLGSSVGGIPEYLDCDSLFAAGDPKAIVEKIVPLLENPEKLAQMSLRNFEFSKAFWPGALQEVKKDFWRVVVENCK